MTTTDPVPIGRDAQGRHTLRVAGHRGEQLYRVALGHTDRRGWRYGRLERDGDAPGEVVPYELACGPQPGEGSCSCPQWRYRRGAGPCKHLTAFRAYLAVMG